MRLENNIAICLILTENKIAITVKISIYFLSPIARLAKVNTEVNKVLGFFNALKKTRILNFPLSRTFLLVPWEFEMADVHCVYFASPSRTVFWDLSFYFCVKVQKLDDSFIFIWKKILWHIFLFLYHILSLGSSGLNCEFIRREYGFLINSKISFMSSGEASFNF